MSDYASLLGEMNAHAEAEAVQREAIAVGRQVLGPGTLTVANLINNLAVTLTSLGRLADAERAFREAFAQHVALLGEKHWRIRNLARNVGRILALQQHYDEALPWMDRALAIDSEPEQCRRHQSSRAFARSARGWCFAWAGVRRRWRGRSRRVHSRTYEGFGRRVRVGLVTCPAGADTERQSDDPRTAEPVARAAVAWFERWGPGHPDAPKRHASWAVRKCFRA